jgi:uncharacterized membrane protein YgcG
MLPRCCSECFCPKGLIPGRIPVPSFLVLMLLVATLLPFSVLQARTLHWSSFNVSAVLENDGTLMVREEQTMVFTGDWNGGERSFNIRPGQQFKFDRIERVGEEGPVQLKKGSLGKLDHWNWHSRNTLRWRSRMPDDPPFSGTAITYVLTYRLGRILVPDGAGGFILNHDFAFSSRSGSIERFHLSLQLAENWQQPGSTLTLDKQDIPPGRSALLTARLVSSAPELVQSYRQTTLPSRSAGAAVHAAPAWVPVLLGALLVLCAAVGSALFFRREIRMDRYAGLADPNSIDEAWLEANVFSLLPETVGAAWDGRTGGHEVAAILARLVVEDRIATAMVRDHIRLFGLNLPIGHILELRLLEPRESFSGYERKLIDGFFIDGEETDTRKIRAHYRKTRSTFNPVSKIRDPLKKRVVELTDEVRTADDTAHYSWLYPLATGIIAFFLLLAQFFVHKVEMIYNVTGVFSGLMFLRAIGFHLFILLALSAFALFNLLGASCLLCLGLFFLHLTVILTCFVAASCNNTPEGVALGRSLVSARRYFVNQLKQERPALRDGWFPYLLAFGLGPRVDRWTRQFGREVGHLSSGHPSRGGLTAGSTGSYGFSGGGGQFGGAGASGSWAVAATSLGVSASSTGSSGGGSSGGGGGGGW